MTSLLKHLIDLFGCAESRSDEASTLLKRASEQIKLKKYDEALELLNSVLEADPNLSEAYLQRASVLRNKCR